MCLRGRHHKKDTGYAWVVCISCFLIYLICDGIGMSFGVLVPDIKKRLGTTTSQAAFIGSLHIGLCYLIAPINLILAKALGFRKVSVIGAVVVTVALIACGSMKSLVSLTVMYGVVGSIGICMIITVAELAVNEWFDQRRALANSIVYSGCSVGYFVSAPILTSVVESYGLQAAFMTEGFVTFLCILLGFFLKTPIEETSRSDTPPENTSIFGRLHELLINMINKEILSDKGFIMYVLGRIFSCFSLLVPLIYVPSLMLEFGKSNVEASLAITILGIFNLVGRLACGVLDKFPAWAIKVNSVACLGSAILLVVMPHCENIYFMYSVCGGYGLMTATMVSLSPSMIVLLIGADRVGPGLGINMFIYGLMSLAGTYFALFCTL